MPKNIAIKVARAEKDMTQKALAEEVGVSRQTINAIEKGEYNPTIKLCRKICRVLNKSLDDLFWEDDAVSYTHLGPAKHKIGLSPFFVRVRTAKNSMILSFTFSSP